MKIVNGSYTSIAYVMRLEDGQQIDSASLDQPLGFVVGAQQMMPGLEHKVLGMQAGEKGSFVIEADEAYGPVRPELQDTLDRSRFPEGVELEQGKVFQAMTPQGVMRFLIVDVGETEVAVDFNHPLAGQRLCFDVEIVEVRDARPEDLVRQHHACGHCSCDDKSCEDRGCADPEDPDA